LPAKAVEQAAKVLDVMALSQASLLPQKMVIFCGSGVGCKVVYIIRKLGLAASRRIATNLEVGVWLPSPTLSSGTNGFTSG
jgi:hypothetical protein